MVNTIKIQMKFFLDNKDETTIIYNALVRETYYNPNNRAITKINQLENSIEIIVEAKDPVSARAAINSYLRWLELSQEIVEIAKSSIRNS